MAQKRDRLRIAVIGLGEAGATFTKGFLVSGLFDVVGYDALIENPSTAERIRARAESLGSLRAHRWSRLAAMRILYCPP